MWNVLITSLFVASNVGSIRSEFFNISSRIAVVAGKSAELSCKTGESNDVKYWDHYRPNITATNSSLTSNIARIYNGVDIREEFKSNINWTRDSRGQWILQITLVNISNSGYYKCGKSEPHNKSSISLTEIISELIVFASDPQCNISKEVLKEDENIELWCNLKYSGSMAPVMKWSKDGIEPDAAINNGSIYNVTRIEVTSKLWVEAASSLHKSKYICKCYFEPSCYPADLLECRPPDYEFIWISPILIVEYQPRYIDINPVKTAFYPGETVNCSANGYPTPDYKWNNLADGVSKTHNGPILAITKEMVSDTEYTYECTASNRIDDNGIRRNITFTVKASFPILTTTTISMGILSMLLLVAILVIRLEYIKHWTAKITARFRRHANVEPGGEAGERDVVPIVDEDPYGGYLGIREVGAYLEMRPESIHDEDNLAQGGIAESAEAEFDCRQIKSDELHPKEMRYSSYFGADGTEYMEMNGFRPPPTTNPPTLPRFTEPVLYARIDHTLPTPSPQFKKSTNFK